MASSVIVGVDIGTTAVRAARVLGVDDDGFAVVSHIASVPLRNDAVLSGRIRNPQAVAMALVRACDQVGAKRNQVVVGAIATEAAVARLTLPSAVRERERLAAVRTMGVQVSPAIAPIDSVMAIHPVGEQTAIDGTASVTVNLAATLQSELAAISNVCRLAKVTPRAIDLLAAGTMRSLVRDMPSSKEVSAIIDVGATTTRVITREGIHLRSVRCFPNGGFDLTRALATAAKESFDDAERRKWAMSLPSQAVADLSGLRGSYAGLEDDEEDEYTRKMTQQNIVERSLSAAAEMLVDQIAGAIDQDTPGATRALTLCGGTALMRGMKERLQKRVGAEVRIGHPWARLERSRANEKHFLAGKEDPRVMLEMVSAIGLGLWSQP
jgi:type IV pilus assembly protein PilM